MCMSFHASLSDIYKNNDKKLVNHLHFLIKYQKVLFQRKTEVYASASRSEGYQNYQNGAVSNQLPTGAGSDRVCFGVKVNLLRGYKDTL
jgi:hypothetical protein